MSGRHWQRDRSARAKCCNGWRPSFGFVCINGDLREVTSWRPINSNDPRFSWEIKPGSIRYGALEDLRRSPFGLDANAWSRDAMHRRALEAQAHKIERDWSTEQRLERLRQSSKLSLIDAHIAGGKLEARPFGGDRC